MLNAEIIRPKFEDKIATVETIAIDKLTYGFLNKSINRHIKQTLSILCIHAFENLEIMTEEEQDKVFDMSNKLVYE